MQRISQNPLTHPSVRATGNGYPRDSDRVNVASLREANGMNQVLGVCRVLDRLAERGGYVDRAAYESNVSGFTVNFIPKEGVWSIATTLCQAR